MTTPAELRALADRVCSEEPWDGLRMDVLAAFGWTRNGNSADRKPDPLRNLSDAAAMMPAGWSVTIRQAAFDWSVVASAETPPYRSLRISAPTEPRARTATALRVMAAMTEASR